MRDQNAQSLLARVMGWQEQGPVLQHVPTLQLLSLYKYDEYQQFGPGKRFIESLALWLNQFAANDRAAALKFVMDHLVFFSDAEMSHLVQMAYPDLITQERMRLVAEEMYIPSHRVAEIAQSRRFAELKLKSLYLGLSDGARTSELRRASDGDIANEQIWHAYELGEEKVKDMVGELGEQLKLQGFNDTAPTFNLIWLVDDFSGSGHTYIRFDHEKRKYSGKIKKIYELLNQSQLVDASHYDVFLLLYVATRQAIDHIEYWSERFTSANGYKPLQLRVLLPIEKEVGADRILDKEIQALLQNPAYCDNSVVDKHFLVGGTNDARMGFSNCALPLVLSHNTPNNSCYVLWGPEHKSVVGLFPRVSRHREF